jgi:signal transduction histidine kinase
VSTFAVLALYPLWAIALATGLVALRLGRETRGGLVLLCLGLAVWVTGLILLVSGAPQAERVLPFGMLLAGAVLHAATDVARVRAPRLLVVAYGYGIAVSLLGLLAPRLLYGPDARGPGPLFPAIGLLSTIGTIVEIGYMLRLARFGPPLERRRRLAVVLACTFGGAGGGGAIALRVYGLGDVELAAPLLVVAVVLTAYAVFSGEEARVRDRLRQGAVQAVITAAFSAVGLTIFYRLLPSLAPDGTHNIGWIALVVFFAALPLDPLRIIFVERTAAMIFRAPIAVPELAARIDASEARADQAERLAEMGRVVSAVAHEIRNPLGVIAAQTKLLERKGVDAASLAGMREQVERARHFLDDLLRYGKPRPLELRAFDAATAVDLAVSNAVQPLGSNAPRVEVSTEGAGSIEADRSAFVDVVTILVSNACIAMIESGARDGTVRVRAARDGSELALSVEDDGPGVPREIEATLFQPFVTGRGRDAAHPGTGLGLAIALRWLERHGGTLVHERRLSPARGARFVARLPLAQ